MFVDSVAYRPTRPRPADPPTTGLAAVPDAWIPEGRSRAFVSSPWGGDYATVTRDDRHVRMKLDSTFSPDVDLDDLGDGRVKILVHMPWPLADVKAAGPMRMQDDGVVHLDDETDARSADMWHMSDGRVHVAVHQPGQSDVDLFLQRV